MGREDICWRVEQGKCVILRHLYSSRGPGVFGLANHRVR